MSDTPFGFVKQRPDFTSRDFDQPTRQPRRDPLEDVFGNTFWGPNWELDDIRDEAGWKHRFSRVYVTKPNKVLVDAYRVLPNPRDFEDGDISEATAKMRELAIEKAARIAKQLRVHNSVHPSERYGLIQVIGADAVTKADVVRAAEGEFVCTAGPQANPQGGEEGAA